MSETREPIAAIDKSSLQDFPDSWMIESYIIMWNHEKFVLFYSTGKWYLVNHVIFIIKQQYFNNLPGTN
jgi:hypothetical protein